MKLSSKIGKTIEIGIYVGLFAYLAKIVGSIFFGYVYLPAEFAGPIFYYWRHKYCDAELAKSSYTFINPKMEDETELFKKISTTFQPIYDPKKYSMKTKELEEIISSEGGFMTSQSAVEKAKKQLAELKERKADTTVTESGTTPLYVSGFTDGFPIGPKKSYRIFRDGKGYNEAALQAEIDFLSFRLVFLNYLSAVTKISTYNEKGVLGEKSPKNYVAIPKVALDVFFNDDNLLSSTEPADGIVQVKFNTEAAKGAETLKMTNSQLEAVKRYIKARGTFEEMIGMLETNQPVVTYDGKAVVVQDKFMKLAEKLVGELNLTELFKGDSKDFETVFKSFIQRISVVKPNAFDIQILNRFYYYYLFTRSYLVAEGEAVEDEKYTGIQNKLNEVKEAQKKLKDNEASESEFNEPAIKYGVFYDKLMKRRVELIFNDLSYVIAWNLGSNGHAFAPGSDERPFILKSVVYPGSYSRKDSDGYKRESGKLSLPMAAS